MRETLRSSACICYCIEKREPSPENSGSYDLCFFETAKPCLEGSGLHNHMAGYRCAHPSARPLLRIMQICREIRCRIGRGFLGGQGISKYCKPFSHVLCGEIHQERRLERAGCRRVRNDHFRITLCHSRSYAYCGYFLFGIFRA